MASARFMRKLRLLTRIYDVPLDLRRGADRLGHDRPPVGARAVRSAVPARLVTWAKKAQNGVLFVSEELATFFQEEKKFNTTWEGDSVGMVRLLALLDKLDLEQVRRTGERARRGLEALARDYTGRSEERARRGRHARRSTSCAPTGAMRCATARSGAAWCCCRPASAALRFYPRYDTEPSAIDEALSILRAGDRGPRGWTRGTVTTGPKIRVGTLEFRSRRSTCSTSPLRISEHKAQILDVEQERYGALKQYPPDVLRAGTAAAAAVPARDARSDARERSAPSASRCATASAGRIVGYALGSALENHDEEGVGSDPPLARTTRSTCRRWPRCRRCRTSGDREPAARADPRARARGRVRISLDAHRGARSPDRPAWLREAQVIRADRQLSAQRHPLSCICRRRSSNNEGRTRASTSSRLSGGPHDRSCHVDRSPTRRRTGRRDHARREPGHRGNDCLGPAGAGGRRGRCRGTGSERSARVAAGPWTGEGETAARGGCPHPRDASGVGRDDDARGRQADDREPRRDRVDDRLLRLLRGDRAPLARHVDPAQLRAPGEFHRQGAVRRGGRDCALQLPAVAHGVEGGAGAGCRQHRRHQAGRRDAARDARAGAARSRSCRREWWGSSPGPERRRARPSCVTRTST